MSFASSLSSQYLYHKINPADIGFANTEQIAINPANRDDIVGQSRAKKSLNFGLNMQQCGYNIFVMGPSGIGRRTMLLQSLNNQKADLDNLFDICYLHNFQEPRKPISLMLPSGKAQELKNDLAEFTEQLLSSFPLLKHNDQFQHIIGKPFNKIKKKYKDFLEVILYLDNIWADLVENIHNIELSKLTPNYNINILVNNQGRKIRPVYYEKNPCYENLFGDNICDPKNNSIPYFSHLSPGSLHKANGGFLIINAEQLLLNKSSWNLLKSALALSELSADYHASRSKYRSEISLFPHSIPLNLKLVLIGNRDSYENLIEWDDEFRKYFKVIVDFDEQVDLNKNNLQQLSLFIARIVKEKELLSFDNTAIARLVEYSLRINDHSQKMYINKDEITSILYEASYWAELDEKIAVTAVEIEHALTEMSNRTNKMQRLSYEEILSNDILIDTMGEKVGQVNGLSIIASGEYSFGQASRISATARMGDGKLVDIEHESDLGGDLHTKGVLILSHYLSARYARDKVFSVSASISFEQSYGGVEGDSASAGELCALLSAISEIPLKQDIAITGSINQFGEIQVVGGINEKIEGFFDICVARTLTGTQGVIIPATNVKNLMLKKTILSAVDAKKFHIYAITHIDEAMALLTGLNPGSRQEDGQFEQNSINYIIEQNLAAMAQPPDEENTSNDENNEPHSR